MSETKTFPFGAICWWTNASRQISSPGDLTEELEYHFEVRDAHAFDEVRSQMLDEFVCFELPIVFKNGNWETETVTGFVHSVSMKKGESRNGYIEGVAVAYLAR